MLPELLEDYVAADNPVRVIETFVDELDLGKLGFQGVDPQATGRPAYHPATLLKIYISTDISIAFSQAGALSVRPNATSN